MAKKANEFTAFLKSCMDELADINLISQNADWIAAKERKQIAALLKRGGTNSKLVSISTALSFCGDNTRRYYGGHLLENSDVIAIVDETNWRHQAHCLSLAFETVERFFRNVGGQCFWQNRSVIRIGNDDHAKFKAKTGTTSPRGTLPYYAEYVQWKFSNSTTGLLDILQDQVPEFKRLANKGALGIDLFDMFGTVSFCRNTIIHSNGIPNPKKMQKLAITKQQAVKDLLKKSVITKCEHILPIRNDVESYITLLCDFYYICYKTLSESCNMVLDFSPLAPTK